MTPVLTASNAALRLTALLAAPPLVPPPPWRTLLQRVLTEASVALPRANPFNARDQALLGLSLPLTRAGAYASWALAHTESTGRLQTAWLACGRWHHDALVALHAGWDRPLRPGSNLALPLEANLTLFAPPPVQTTAIAQLWLDRLTTDFLTLTAPDARLGLAAIPGGVWIAP